MLTFIDVRSEERVVYNLGLKQGLLSPAAGIALEDENMKMLEVLHESGWNYSECMGIMPRTKGEEEDVMVKLNPLTFSVLLGKKLSIQWLLSKSPNLIYSRDCYFERGIDVLLENNPENKELLKMLKSEEKPSTHRLFEQLTGGVCHKFGNKPLVLSKVNNQDPGDFWESFDVVMKKSQKIIYKDEKKKQIKKGNVLIKAQWEKIGENKYKYSFSSDGGGLQGVVYFKYGYWLVKGVEYWDS